MRYASAVVSALVLVACLGGCALVAEVKGDQNKIRNALVELYTNQIIDNLILAANGMPFIQVDYTNATSTVTVAENGSLGGGQSVTDTRPLNAAARLAAVARGSPIRGTTAGVSNSNQIAVTANPATSNPDDDAYLEFLSLPGSLRVSCDPPPDVPRTSAGSGTASITGCRSSTGPSSSSWPS